ncbi:MAG: head-tail connector protein [Candidatus Adiutrix sp.]|jgi:hypothetical protein|nr:head-tail connector protein [Candidatus Adiutrix sp.]
MAEAARKIIDLDDERKKHILRRLGSMEQERASWESHWRDISQHFFPRRSRFLNAGERTNEGDRRNFLESGVGIKKLKNLMAVMQSGITSPSRPWFSLSVQDLKMARTGAVKAWLHHVQQQMVNVFRRSNFYDQIHLLYGELGAFGTGSTLVEDDPVSVIRLRTLTVGEYCIDTDASGRVNTLYRRVRMTARQMAEAWPETVPDEIRRRAERDNDEWLTVIHAVEPNPGYREGSLNARQRRHLSVYMLENKEVLEVGGFYEFPALCPRWDSTGSDVYGSSPCMDALPDCRQLQKMTETGRLGLEKQMNPPMGIYGIETLDVSPGAMNPMSSLAQGQMGAKPLYEVNLPHAALAQDKEAIKNDISEALFNDLLLLISSQNRAMTATQADIMNNEKLLLLGPVLDRLRSELFQPLIERVYGIMDRLGMIAPPPPEMDGQEINIEFISVLANGQKMAGKASIFETLEFVGTAAQATQNPGVLDKFNVDVAIDEIADMNGVPPSVIRSEEEVEALRAQREQQMQAAQSMAMMKQGVDIAAGGAKAVRDSGLPPEAMAAMAGAMGGANATVQ